MAPPAIVGLCNDFGRFSLEIKHKNIGAKAQGVKRPGQEEGPFGARSSHTNQKVHGKFAIWAENCEDAVKMREKHEFSKFSNF